MASLLTTRINEVFKGLEIYVLKKTLQAIESEASSDDTETLVEILMSDIVDIGLQIVLSRLSSTTLHLLLKNIHLDPENREQSQTQLEEHITSRGVRDYLLNVDKNIIAAIIKDLGIESSPRDVMAAELDEEVVLSGLEYLLQSIPVILLKNYFCKSLQINPSSQKKQGLVEEIIKAIVAGYLSSIVPDNEIDSPRSAEKASKRRSIVSNKRNSIVARRRSHEYSPSAESVGLSILDPLDNTQPRALSFNEFDDDDVPMESDSEVEDLTKEFNQSLNINRSEEAEKCAHKTEDIINEHGVTSEQDVAVDAQTTSRTALVEQTSSFEEIEEESPSVDLIDASVASDDATVGAEQVEVQIEDELNASMETSQDADEMSIDANTIEAGAEHTEDAAHESEPVERNDDVNEHQDADEAHEEKEDEEQGDSSAGIHIGISKKELESMLVKDLKSYMKEHGLNYNGRKVLLVKRILDHLEELEEAQRELESVAEPKQDEIVDEDVDIVDESVKEDIIEDIKVEEKPEPIAVEEVVPKSARKRGRPRKNPLPEHEDEPETPSNTKSTRRRRGAQEEEAEKEVKRSTAKKLSVRSKSAQKRRKAARTSMSDEHDLSELHAEKSSPTKTTKDKATSRRDQDSESEESYEFDNKENANYEILVPTPPPKNAKSKGMPTPKMTAFIQPYTPSSDVKGILKSPMTPRTKRKSVSFHATVKKGSPAANIPNESSDSLIDVNATVSVLQPVNANIMNNVAPVPAAKPSRLQQALNRLRNGNLFS